MNPLWNGTIIGGVRKDTGESFLGTVDYFGTKVESNFLLTVFALYYCQVLMQNAWKPDLTEDEAKKVIEDGMRVLFYRDKKATDEIQICKITREKGVEMLPPYKVDSEWGLQFYKEKTNEHWRPMRIFNQ